MRFTYNNRNRDDSISVAVAKRISLDSLIAFVTVLAALTWGLALVPLP